MFHLWMSVILISVSIANSSALFHVNMQTVIVIQHLKKHKQLQGLLYEMKTSLQSQTSNVSGSLALCCR